MSDQEEKKTKNLTAASIDAVQRMPPSTIEVVRDNCEFILDPSTSIDSTDLSERKSRLMKYFQGHRKKFNKREEENKVD